MVRHQQARGGVHAAFLVVELMHRAGWVLGNLDATVVAQAPRMALQRGAHLGEAAARVDGACGEGWVEGGGAFG